MTADLSSFSTAPPAPHSGAMRAVVAVVGIVAVLIGVFLLFHPYSAARTLALFVGLAFVVGGCLEIVTGWDSSRRGSSVAVGIVLILTGVLAATWPKVTLGTVAVITGLGLIVHGIGRLALAFVARHEIPGWGWLAAAGLFNVLIGVLALVWPAATVLVLSLVLGAQILIFGVILTLAAFWGGRGSTHASGPPAYA